MRLLFPTVIHEIKFSNFDQDMCVKIAKQFKKEDSKGVEKSNIGGWQSEVFQFKKNDYFSDLISHTVGNHLRKNKIYKQIKLDFAGYWININQPGASNNMHNHPNCDLSGVMWIKTDEKSGAIRLRHPNIFAEQNSLNFYDEDFAKKNNTYAGYWLDTKPGNGILFPSHLEHWVEQNKSTEDRISISFNIGLRL